MKRLSEQSPISIGFAIFLIGGAAAWMQSVKMEISAHADGIARINTVEDQIFQKLDSIDRRLSIMEWNATKNKRGRNEKHNED